MSHTVTSGVEVFANWMVDFLLVFLSNVPSELTNSCRKVAWCLTSPCQVRVLFEKFGQIFEVLSSSNNCVELVELFEHFYVVPG